ncbi:MAG: glycosyltransferase family 2 protein [Desulfuromonadaceae bacterium]|nr:glycosyltransferase family 2 protein [Desulfuromonadaceae bacterium]MDD2854375.1 glycosyltransferase family 2 protein [Desulfuromonadaceae bacterium]
MQKTTALPISAYIITKNEHDKIVDCLFSLDFVDEAVVVDDYSQDGTSEVAIQNGARVISNKFKGFKDQKSFAMDQTLNDWVLELDADERISSGMRSALLELKPEDFQEYDGFAFKRITRFWGKWIKHSSLYPDYKVRLYNKHRGKWSGGSVHERFIPEGKIKRLSVDILHPQDLDMKSYMGRISRYAELSAIDYAAAGRNWSCIDFLRPVHTFFYRLIIRLGFLDGIHGFAIAFFGAIGTFLKYAYLLEITRNFKSREKP